MDKTNSLRYLGFSIIDDHRVEHLHLRLGRGDVHQPAGDVSLLPVRITADGVAG